jgi:EpsD family peptidyl-prolyl cis-trans isomerase
MASRRTCTLGLLVAIAVIAACAKQDERKKPATQVAARVNSEEITVHQVNSQLAKIPNLAPEAADRAKSEVLDRLVEQELARQHAIGKKLDRTPAVQQSLETARSEILARAFREYVAAAQLKPTADEIKRYYAEHPELFAERRVFELEELTFFASEEIATALRERASKARTLQEIAEWLKARAIRFAANRGVRAAEQIPLELLPKLHAAQNGDLVVVQSGGAGQVIRIAASRTEPVDEAVAAPRIEQFLANRRATEAIAKEMKALKEGAKIEYFGEFAEGPAAAEAKAKALAEARAKAEAAAKEKSDAEARARAEDATKARIASEDRARLEAEAKARAAAVKVAPLPQHNIEKGVSGLR